MFEYKKSCMAKIRENRKKKVPGIYMLISSISRLSEGLHPALNCFELSEHARPIYHLLLSASFDA